MADNKLDFFTRIIKITVNVTDLLVVQTALFGVDLPVGLAADPSGAFVITGSGVTLDMLANKITVVGNPGKTVSVVNPATVAMFVNLNAWTQGPRFKSNTLLDADGYYIQTLFINIGKLGDTKGIQFQVKLRADLNSTAYNLDFWTFAKKTISTQIKYNFALNNKNLAGGWTSFASSHLAANNGTFHAPATKTLRITSGLGLTLS